MRVAALQHDIVWEDRDATLAHVAPQIQAAASEGAQLVVLTELFATGFSMATDRVAEPEGGSTSEFANIQFRLRIAKEQSQDFRAHLGEQAAQKRLPHCTLFT